MYKQKIAITINSDFDKEKLFNEFIMLTSSLNLTGQIVGKTESSYFTENEIICYQTTLERGSLDAKYNNKWVDVRIKNLEEWCNSKLRTEFLGQHFPFYKNVCSCDRHGSYVLFTTFLNDSSPIDCGNCGRPVPVYQLKELTDEERYDLKSWEIDYISCDNLNIGCTVGEKWAIKQMSDPSSQLSQSGLGICSRITKITGIPVYYYLLNYRNISAAKDKLRMCPSCNREWLLKEKWLELYDFKCDYCKLVSTLTSNIFFCHKTCSFYC